MYAQVEKQKENKSWAVANSVAQKSSNGKQCFADNRSETIVQRKLKDVANNKALNGLFERGNPTIQRFYAVKDDENTLAHPEAKTGNVDKLGLEWIDLPDPRDETVYSETVPGTGWWARNLYRKPDANHEGVVIDIENQEAGVRQEIENIVKVSTLENVESVIKPLLGSGIQVTGVLIGKSAGLAMMATGGAGMLVDEIFKLIGFGWAKATTSQKITIVACTIVRNLIQAGLIYEGSEFEETNPQSKGTYNLVINIGAGLVLGILDMVINQIVLRVSKK